MSWATWSGRKVDPYNLTVDDIVVDDIAVSLSHINRWNGHTSEPFSVAQHSVILAHIVPEIYGLTGQAALDAAAAALLHDGTETYLQDLISCEKDKVYFKLSGSFVPYKTIESRAREVIFARFGIPIEYLAYVEPWDVAIRANEEAALRPASDRKPVTVNVDILPWTPEQARKAFLQMFHDLKLDLYERIM